MNPLHIVSHVACSEPGYFCEYLDSRGIAYQRIDIESGDLLPPPETISGLVLLGAPVSVNSGQAWIEQEMALVRDCAEREVPVFGICFGAQLIGKALGGEVFPAPSLQIGWHPVNLTEQGRELFGENGMPARFEAFEWHADSFTLPPGALPLFNGGCIDNQGFLHGSCLGVQFHPEVSKAMVESWVARYLDCLDPGTHCIQSPTDILRELGDRLSRMREMSDQLFDWWLSRVTPRGSTKLG